jgi:hypothetical protein
MPMHIRHHARGLVTLAAAYAVALQAILAAVGGPITAGAGEFGALPICSGLGAGLGAGHATPLGHSGACPGTCFGCCCAPPPCQAPGPAVSYAPAQTVAAAFVAAPPPVVSVPAAHRSRAPPLA